MPELKVNCLVCGEPLTPIRNNGELTYHCRGKTWCDAGPIDIVQATNLVELHAEHAAMQQRVAELEELAEDALTCNQCKFLLGGHPEHYISGWHCPHKTHIDDADEQLACEKFIGGDNQAGITQVDSVAEQRKDGAT